MRWIEPGAFPDGSGNEEIPGPGNASRLGNLYQVSLANGLWLAETLCTQALWLAVMKSSPSNFAASDPAVQPVEQISWNDIDDFTNRFAANLEKCEVRLPMVV